MTDPLRTCGNCDGDGGYETVTFPTSKWDDPTPGGEWIDCPHCAGFGWEEGEPEPIEQDELPPPVTEDPGRPGGGQRERE